MADNTVQIILSAVDNASAVIKGEKTALDGLSDGFKQLTGFSLGAAGAIAAGVAAFKAIIDYTKQAVSETNDYVTSVSDMSRVLGISTEETSRLIQASDDLFISQDKLNAALLAASRKGIDVSITGLKSLSSQYLALNPGVERAQFLMQTFGRSGADMGKLMEQGADGIQKATDAIADNLVVTGKSAEDVKKYKQTVDELGDTWQGVKYTVGEKVIPVLTDLMKVVTNNENVWQFFKRVNNEAKAANPAMDAWSASLNAQADAYKKLHPEIDATTESLLSLKDEYSAVSSLAGELQNSEENLANAEKDLADYQKSHKWDTSGIEERKAKVDELKDAQQDMIAKWMLGVYQQMLTADGDLSDADMQFLLDYQVDSGLISQENANRAKSYWDQANAIMSANALMQVSVDSLHGKDIVIRTIYQSLTQGGTSAATAASIATGVASGEGLKHPHSNGGSWVIPSSYGNEGYPMGGGHTASANETITVTPAGKSVGMTDEQVNKIIASNQAYGAVLLDSIKNALRENR